LSSLPKSSSNGISNRVTPLPDSIKFSFGAVLVDPPRCGLDDITCNLIKQYSHIIYISCNPVALMRDLVKICNINNDKEKRESKLELENKMRHVIQRFAIFDHFAYTEHLECGVYLRKVIIE